MHLSKFWGPVAILIVVLTMLGCGGSGGNFTTPPSVKAEFLYASTMLGSTTDLTASVFIFKVDTTTGALTNTSTLPLPSPFSNFAISPNSKTFYVTDERPNVNLIDNYSINAETGALTSVGFLNLNSAICPFCPIQNGPGPLVMDPAGKFLYYGSNTFGLLNQSVGSLSVDAGGALSVVQGSPFPADAVPFVLAIHPQGKFVFTENMPVALTNAFQVQSISGFSVAANGVLTPVANSPYLPPVTMDIGSFQVHPSGKFLYATSASSKSGVIAWAIDDSTGELTVLPGSPFFSGTAMGTITLDRTGKFLYLTSGASGGIFVFSIDPNTGVLTTVNGSPFGNGNSYGTTTIDPSGRFLFAFDFHGMISTFKLDSNTGIPSASGSPVSTGGRPISLVSIQAP